MSQRYPPTWSGYGYWLCTQFLNRCFLCSYLCAVTNNYAVASALALGYYGVCAELAQESSRGPGSFMVNFLDVLSNSDTELVSKKLKIYKRG